MKNYAFLVFHNFNHRIKDFILWLSCWFSTLNYIHELKTERSVIPIESNTGEIYFKPAQVIWWWTDANYFMNCNIYVLKIIDKIQYSCSYYMHSRYMNVYPEQVSMCY